MSAHYVLSTRHELLICIPTATIGGSYYYHPRIGNLQSCAAGGDGLKFQSRQTAVPGPTRGDITTRRLGRAAEVEVGRGQVGFVALGAMGTAEWRSQEVRDINAGNRN